MKKIIDFLENFRRITAFVIHELSHIIVIIATYPIAFLLGMKYTVTEASYTKATETSSFRVSLAININHNNNDIPSLLIVILITTAPTLFVLIAYIIFAFFIPSYFGFVVLEYILLDFFTTQTLLMSKVDVISFLSCFHTIKSKL